jgi:hypothetical protein
MNPSFDRNDLLTISDKKILFWSKVSVHALYQDMSNNCKIIGLMMKPKSVWQMERTAILKDLKTAKLCHTN